MNEEKRCSNCKFCTQKVKSAGIGLCTEEHQPTNAKGEHKATIHLKYKGCGKWQPAINKPNPPKIEPIDEISFEEKPQPKQKRAYHRKTT